MWLRDTNSDKKSIYYDVRLRKELRRDQGLNAKMSKKSKGKGNVTIDAKVIDAQCLHIIGIASHHHCFRAFAKHLFGYNADESKAFESNAVESNAHESNAFESKCEKSHHPKGNNML